VTPTFPLFLTNMVLYHVLYRWPCSAHRLGA
jgi:hypothetical protein